MGAGGIRVGRKRFLKNSKFLGPPQSGVESNALLRVVNTTISDCYIEDGGHYYAMGVGVFGQQVQNLFIRHNSIHDFSYSGLK